MHNTDEFESNSDTNYSDEERYIEESNPYKAALGAISLVGLVYGVFAQVISWLALAFIPGVIATAPGFILVILGLGAPAFAIGLTAGFTWLILGAVFWKPQRY